MLLLYLYAGQLFDDQTQNIIERFSDHASEGVDVFASSFLVIPLSNVNVLNVHVNAI
jgi:hypothetical protein